MRLFLLIVAALSGVVVEALLPRPSDKADINTLQLVQIIWRHGDRTPIVQYPNDPFQNETLWLPYATGFSSLTLKGRRMHFNFGKYLRDRYDGFLSAVYSPDEINVQSSDTDRAIMSGMSNMAGLWPPTKEKNSLLIEWQPVPIHTLPKKLDNFINFGADCPRFKELKNFGIQESKFAKSINNDPENVKLCKYIIEKAGVKECDFQTVSDIWDTLRIQKSYNMTLPDWVAPVYDQMEKLSPLFFDTRVLFPKEVSEESKRVKAGPLMSFLVKNMEKRKKGEKVAKMYALSGHDTTSSIALGALGVFDTQFPIYASAAIFELHKINNDHVVKVFFRNNTYTEDGDPVTGPPFEFEIPNCGYPCKLDKFKTIVSPILVDGEEWEKACKAGGSKNGASTATSNFSPLLLLITLLGSWLVKLSPGVCN